MPYNKFDIKVGNAASQKNLEEFILSIDNYLGELLENFKRLNRITTLLLNTTMTNNSRVQKAPKSIGLLDI